jgi:hypothetical protein
MSYRLILSDDAGDDIYHAQRWYEEQKTGPGDEFFMK